jgi:hypothetical protein
VSGTGPCPCAGAAASPRYSWKRTKIAGRRHRLGRASICHNTRSLPRAADPLYGAPCWTRTSDPQLRRLLLYPTELRAPLSASNGAADSRCAILPHRDQYQHSVVQSLHPPIPPPPACAWASAVRPPTAFHAPTTPPPLRPAPSGWSSKWQPLAPAHPPAVSAPPDRSRAPSRR